METTLIPEMLSWNIMALLLLEVVVYITTSFLVSFYYCIVVLNLFIVYKQINKLNSSDSGMPTHRSKFDVHNFAAKYDLGSPVAGNYFKAERH